MGLVKPCHVPYMLWTSWLGILGLSIESRLTKTIRNEKMLCNLCNSERALEQMLNDGDKKVDLCSGGAEESKG